MKNQNCKAAAACIFLLTCLFFIMSVLRAGATGLPAGGRTAKTGCNWAPDKQLLTDLYVITAGNTEALADGMRVRFNDGFLKATSDDIVKMMNFGENLSSYRENRDLVLEKRPLISLTDTIFLHFTNAGSSNYSFKIHTVNFEGCGLEATIQDSYTNQRTVLKLDGSINVIDFKITADPASADPFRFRIIFGPAAILPVTITSFRAVDQGTQVLLNWQVSNQLNMQQYEVERSDDAIHFSNKYIQAVTANNSSTSSYSWADKNPATGSGYYRIRCVGIAGDITWSQVIAISRKHANAGISIYPNPVTGSTVILQFTGMQKGVYRL